VERAAAAAAVDGDGDGDGDGAGAAAPTAALVFFNSSERLSFSLTSLRLFFLVHLVFRISSWLPPSLRACACVKIRRNLNI
jgi:hypothetical protein